MGTKNEETVARAKETEIKLIDISRGDGVIGRKGKDARNQQKRDNRASSQESSIFTTGADVTGGMLDHLIDEYGDQVALKEDEIHRLSEEVNRLKSRVQEFKALRQELQKQFEEAS